MTPDLLACADRSKAAERAGDAEAALEWHQSVPMFRKGRHRSLLDQLCGLGQELPEWVWARWIAYQAGRCEDGDTGGAVRARLGQVIEALHIDLLEACYRSEGDPVRVVARVAGESWAFHQLATHEGGGIASFVDEFATGRLAEQASLARTWAGAPMSGYQLGACLPGARLRVREAGRTKWHDILDLGARTCSPGGWVLGRLVPSGIGDLQMFDMPPLEVSARTAQKVARLTDGDWLGVLARSSQDVLREDYQLATDVLDLELLRFGTPRRELGRVMQELRGGRDEISPAAYRVLGRAARGEVEPADQAYVGAAVLNPRAYQDARRDAARSHDTASWAAWADCVALPARSRLLALAAAGQSAA